MKKIISYTIILIALSVNTVSAQIKILFDATKAEAAANADWVIDADTHNLTYSNGPAQTGGDESNPQRYPVPTQSTVTSSTPETYWEGGISAWGIDMVKKGYEVETLPLGVQITYGNTGNAQDLSNYKVFVVVEPNIVFTSAEKIAILAFVQNGGGLFMVSDHDGSDRNNDGWDSPHIWNDFMDTTGTHPFGMHFNYDTFSQTTTNVANLPGNPLLHGVMGNVTEVQWSGGTSMTLSTTNNSSVKGVVYKTGSSTTGLTNALVAYATYGNGRVVGFGDSSPCDDGTGDPNDQLYTGWLVDAAGNHEKLIVNATIWLAGSTSTIAEEPQLYNVLINQLTYPDKMVFDISSSDNIDHSTFSVYDLLGNQVSTMAVPDSKTVVINNGSLSKGLYIYKLTVNGTVAKTGKFAML